MFIHCGSEAHGCAPFPGLRGCCQNLLMCMWQTWEHIKALAFFFFFGCQRFERANWGTRPWVWGLFVLTWPCVSACMRVCTSACVCTHLCGAPHQRAMEWLSCYDLWPWHAPRQREGRGGGKKKKKTQSNMLAHTFTQGKRVGSAQSLNVQQLEKQPQTET